MYTYNDIHTYTLFSYKGSFDHLQSLGGPKSQPPLDSSSQLIPRPFFHDGLRKAEGDHGLWALPNSQFHGEYLIDTDYQYFHIAMESLWIQTLLKKVQKTFKL